MDMLRTRILIADPDADYVGDLAAYLSDRYDVIVDAGAEGRWQDYLRGVDLVILAGDLLPRRDRPALLRECRRVIALCRSDDDCGRLGTEAGAVIPMERFPSPESLDRALSLALAS